MAPPSCPSQAAASGGRGPGPLPAADGLHDRPAGWLIITGSLQRSFDFREEERREGCGVCLVALVDEGWRVSDGVFPLLR